jgi:TolA-binding protein
MLLVAAPAWAGSNDLPSESELWRAAGNSYAGGGQDKSSALKQYRLLVSAYGGSDRVPRAQYMVGECLFAMGDFPAAREAFHRAYKKRGNDEVLAAAALLRMGECHFNLGEFDDAVNRFEECVKKHTKTFQAGESLYALGETYVAQERWDRLDQVFLKLLETRPAYAEREGMRLMKGLLAYQRQEYQAAINELRHVESDRGLFFWGRALEDDGQYLRAVQKYTQLQKKYPQSSLADDAAFAAADAFFSAGQYRLAIDAYNQFVNDWPDSPFYPNALYKLAAVSFGDGRYEDAIRSLEVVRAKFPHEEIRANADYLVGNSHLELGHIPEAIFAYTRVVEEFPRSRIASAALHKMVVCYANDGNYGQAHLLAGDFLDRYPGDPLAGRVLLLRGYCLRALNEPDRAVRDFQAVVDQYPTSSLAERALYLATLTFHERQQFDRMITTFRHVADRLLPTDNPWRAETYYRFGDAYFSLDLHQDAAEMYRLVLTGYPRADVAGFALQGLTAAYARMGLYEKALEEQEKFLLAMSNQESESSRNQIAVAAIHFNKKNYEGALKSYRSFLDDNPDDPAAAGALLQMGDAYYRLQYYEDAISTWRRLLEQFPDGVEANEALYKIADTTFGLGRFDDAAQVFARIVAQGAGNPHAIDAAFNVGNCYYNLKRDEEAIDAFQSFLAAYPYDDRAEAARQAIQSSFYRSGRSVEEYLAANPHSPLAADLLWQQGQDAFAAEDYTMAARRFQRVALEFPDSQSASGAVFYLAESHYKADDLNEALATYTNFLDTYPDHELASLAAFRVGVTHFRLEAFESTVSSFERLLHWYGDSEYAPMAAYNVTLALARLEDWPAYIEAADRVVERFPGHEKRAELRLQVGVVFQDEMGAYGDAVGAYRAALEEPGLNPAEVHYRIGECHQKLEQLEEALASFMDAAEAGPESDPYRIAALAEAGEIFEKRSQWQAALEVYKSIKSAGGKSEWTELAEARIAAVEARAQ